MQRRQKKLHLGTPPESGVTAGETALIIMETNLVHLSYEITMTNGAGMVVALMLLIPLIGFFVVKFADKMSE